MSNALFAKGRNAFLSGAINWTVNSAGVGQTMSMLLDMTASAPASSFATIVLSATNGSPMTIKTTTNHGYSNGDIVVVGGVLGLTCANNTWKIAGVTSNTFTLTTKVDGLNSTGNNFAAAQSNPVVYTGGGWCMDLTAATYYNDVSGSRAGTDTALTNETAAGGTANANAWTHTSVVGNTVNGAIAPIQCFVLYASSTVGNASDRQLEAFYDGKTQVYVDSGSFNVPTTVVVVTPLIAAIPTATVVYFSNGSSGTLGNAAAVGDRILTFANAPYPTLPPAGTTADCTTTNAGLPVTPNGGNITITPDAGTNKLFTL